MLFGSAKAASAVELDRVLVEYDGFKALNGLTCQFRPGCVNGLIGPNGAGKSTLLNVLSGFAKAQSGTLTIEGRDLTNLAPQRAALEGIARTFQFPRLFKHLSVLDNVVCALPRRKTLSVAWPWQPSPALQSGRESGLQLLQSFRAEHLAGAKVVDLSLPQQRVIELARVIAAQPRLILLDEPSSGLGVDEGGKLIAQGLKLLPSSTTVVLVSHDIDIVFRMSSWVVTMCEGRTLAQGTPDEIKGDREVRRAYLGAAR